MSKLVEETYYVCSIKGCNSCVFDKEFIFLGCARHGDTLVRLVRQFENDKLVSEFKEQPDA